MKDIKIALFGGTFDPVHNAHVMLAEQMYEKINPDRFIIMPNSVPYHKNHDNLTPDTDRLAMCRIAFDEKYEVSEMEMQRGGPTYTIDTIEKLYSENKDAVIYLICGSDMFLTLKAWKRYEDLIRQTVVCVAPRRGSNIADIGRYAEDIERDGGCVIISDKILPKISSTEVRNLIIAGINASDYVPMGVYEYIMEKGLYKK